MQIFEKKSESTSSKKASLGRSSLSIVNFELQFSKVT